MSAPHHHLSAEQATSYCSIYSIGIGIRIAMDVNIGNSTSLNIYATLGSGAGMHPLFQVEVLPAVINCM